MDYNDEIWTATLDQGKFDARVVRVDDCNGILTLSEGSVILKSQDVGLAYRAVFGPDIDDVETWQMIILKWLDELGL